MVGDFNFREVHWQLFEAGGNKLRGRLLQLVVNYKGMQWVIHETNYRIEKEPSRLGLLFSEGGTKGRGELYI